MADTWYDPTKLQTNSDPTQNNLLGILNSFSGGNVTPGTWGTISGDNIAAGGDQGSFSQYSQPGLTNIGSWSSASDPNLKLTNMKDGWLQAQIADANSQGKTYDQSGADAAYAAYLKGQGLDPTGNYYRGSFANPYSNMQGDTLGASYQLDDKGNMTPVFASNYHPQSWWTGMGQDMLKGTAAVAGTAFGLSSLAGTLGGAGAADGAGGMALQEGAYPASLTDAAGSGFDAAGNYIGAGAGAADSATSGMSVTDALSKYGASALSKMTNLTPTQLGSLAKAGITVGAALASSNGGAGTASTGTQSQMLQDALKKQLDTADQLAQFNRQNYAANQGRLATADGVTNQVVGQNLGTAADAASRASAAGNVYTANGLPVIQKSLNDAMNYDSQGNIDAARGRATADVAQGFAQADQQSQNALSRMGINPSSGRFMALQQSMGAQKAAALAGAATNAEQGIRDKAIDLRANAGNLANNTSAAANTSANTSTTAANSAGVASGQGLQNGLNVGTQNVNGMSTTANIYGNAAGGNQASINSTNLNNQALQKQANDNATGWGKLAGDFVSSGALSNLADGGPVRGPGTGTSDSVPAVNVNDGRAMRLSNGEYVISADVVRAKGREFFDKLQQKYHTPVNVGRAA